MEIPACRGRVPRGVTDWLRFRFRPELAERVRSLAAAEQECCSFLRFEVVEGGDDVVMTVETEEAGQEALRFMFGPS